ncbi:glycerol-3-phosphate dehydrogenase/oxidase, partial [Frankia sp. Cpl3]|nr:glycerol-3-phosphate dehydrogenase/oxidase [Frankia sp. Cpl3]
MLTKAETIKIEPSLNPRGLIGGGLYVEYMTDDARLTIEIAKTAASLGARLCNHAEAVDFLYQNDRVVGVQ